MGLKLVLKKKKVKLIANPFADIPDPFGYGQRAVDFLRSLKHPKSRHPEGSFQLDPWQERIVRQIYGPRHPDGTRIVKTAFILIPRGNRKTSLGAALALLHTMGPEAVPGGEVLTAAADRKQAKLAFTEAEGIIGAGDADLWRKGQASRRFDAAETIKVQDYKNRITFPNGSFIESLSSDAGTQHGRSPTMALVDELHSHKKPDLWQVVRTGLAKTKGSLLVVITTAGRGQENLAYKVTDYARKVAHGDIKDPAFLPVLFEASPDEDWEDETVWHRVNPGLKLGYPDLEGLRQLAREAKERPGDREAFKQLHLNMWADHSATPFVEMKVYDEGAEPFDLRELEHEPCWLGVDVSSNSDLTAVVACWRDPDKEGGYIVHPWFFCPGENIEKRTQQSGYPYSEWAETGALHPTPGNVIDIRMVEDHIRDLCERFEVREIAADPHYARIMLSNLVEDGYPAIQFRQGWMSIGPAIHELEKAILARRFRHGGHPVLRWNFDNIAIQDDGKGNRSFNKSKARDKIDGAVAAAMAVGRAATGEDTRSIYDSDERAEGLLIF
jgi:phage terminase large subunit-like protein